MSVLLKRLSLFLPNVLWVYSFIKEVHFFKSACYVVVLRSVPIDKILSVKNARAWVSLDFTLAKYSATMTIEKMKILGAILELPARQHCQSSLFIAKLGQIGQIGSAV